MTPRVANDLQVLEAELFQAVLRDVLTHRCLIIIAVFDADMAHPVEMRADMTLAELGFLHVGRLFLPYSPPAAGYACQDALRNRVPASGMPSIRF